MQDTTVDPTLSPLIHLLPFQTIFINPYLVHAMHNRGKSVVAVFNGDAERRVGMYFARRVGVDAVAVRDVRVGVSVFGAYVGNVTTPTTPEVNPTPISPPVLGEGGGEAGVSETTRWTVAVAIIPCVIGVVGMALFALRYQSRRLSAGGDDTDGDGGRVRRAWTAHGGSSDADDSSTTIAVSSDAEQEAQTAMSVSRKTRMGVMTLFEAVCLGGWLIFTIGGEQATTDALIPSPAAFFYLLAIIGPVSCTLSGWAVYHPSPRLVSIQVLLSAFACFVAGYVVHSNERVVVEGNRLMMTGGAIFAGSKAAGVFAATFGYSKVKFEEEAGAVVCAVAAAVGWICVIIGVGRYSADFPDTVSGIGDYGVAVLAILAAILLALSSGQNSRWLGALAGSCAVLAVFFCGGVVGDSIRILQECHEGTQIFGCGYHFRLMLSGAIISAVSLAIAVAVKSWRFESDESRELRRNLRAQVLDIWTSSEREEEAMNSAGMPVGVMAASFPAPPHLPTTFVAVTQDNAIWTSWRLFAALAIIGWTVVLGGFGALTPPLLPTNVIVAGLLCALTSPGAIVLLLVALVQDSRKLAFGAFVTTVIQAGSTGRFLTAAAQAKDENFSPQNGPAYMCIIVGSSLLLIFIGALWCLAMHRLLLPPYLTMSLKERKTNRDVIVSTLALATVGWLTYTIGVGIYNRNLPDTFRGVNTAVPTLSAVLGVLTILCYVTCHLWAQKADANQAVEDDVDVQITVASVVPAAIMIATVSQIGATVYMSGQMLRFCALDDLTCANGARGPIVILVGALLYLGGLTLWMWHMLMHAESWVPDIQEEDTVSVTGRLRMRLGKGRRRRGANVEEKVKAKDRLDLHGLVMSWPQLQVAFKVLLLVQLGAYSVFLTAFAKVRPDGNENLSPVYGGHVILAVTGICAPLLNILWFLRGGARSFIMWIFSLLLTIAMSGYVFFRKVGDPQSLETGMLVGAVFYAASSTGIFALSMTWRKLSAWPQHEQYSRIILGVAMGGWTLFTIAFGVLVQDRSGQVDINSGRTAAEIALVVLPLVHVALYTGILYVENARLSVFLRIVMYATQSISICSGGAVFYSACLDVNEITPTVNTSAGAAELIGSLLYLGLQFVFIFHRQHTFNDIDLSDAAQSELAWISRPRHAEEGAHWLNKPSFGGVRALVRLFFFLVSVAWLAFVTGFAKLDPRPSPLDRVSATVFDAFAIATACAVAGWGLRLTLRWVTFGVAGTLAALLALATGGSSIFGANPRPRDTPVILTMAGAMVALFALVMLIVILLHRRNIQIPMEGGRSWAMRTVAIVAAFGYMLFLAGFAVKGGKLGGGVDSAAGYLMTTVPGAFAVLGMIYEILGPSVRSLIEARKAKPAKQKEKPKEAKDETAKATSNSKPQGGENTESAISDKATSKGDVKKKLPGNFKALKKIGRKNADKEKKQEKQASTKDIGEDAGKEADGGDGTKAETPSDEPASSSAANVDSKNKELDTASSASGSDSSFEKEMTTPPPIQVEPTPPRPPEQPWQVRLPNIFFTAFAVIVSGIPVIVLSNDPLAFTSTTPSNAISVTTNSTDPFQNQTTATSAVVWASAFISTTTISISPSVIPTPSAVSTSTISSATPTTLYIDPDLIPPFHGPTNNTTPLNNDAVALKADTGAAMQFIGALLMLLSNAGYILGIEVCGDREDVKNDAEAGKAGDKGDQDGELEESESASGTMSEEDGVSSEGSVSVQEGEEKSGNSSDGGSSDEVVKGKDGEIAKKKDDKEAAPEKAAPVVEAASVIEKSTRPKSARTVGFSRPQSTDLRKQVPSTETELTPNTEKAAIDAARMLQLSADVRRLQEMAQSRSGDVLRDAVREEDGVRDGEEDGEGRSHEEHNAEETDQTNLQQQASDASSLLSDEQLSDSEDEIISSPKPQQPLPKVVASTPNPGPSNRAATCLRQAPTTASSNHSASVEEPAGRTGPPPSTKWLKPTRVFTVSLEDFEDEEMDTF
ncbi:hypothetical protein HK104_011280 [Borealophlyctis nickersoniae]|nr:hypothetical protein HK104_011280 [Borealophlyctis nickersoniae]